MNARRGKKPTPEYKPPPLGCTVEIRAMPGLCPIPVQSFLGLPPNEIEILDWFERVRAWGLARKEYLTKICIINWGLTIFDPEDADRIASILEELAQDVTEE